MYDIWKLLNGKWYVECRIQDGTERWEEPTREKAVQSLIQAARTLNGSYIREDDISFGEEEPPPVTRSGDRILSTEEVKLLSDISRGAKVPLEFDHYLLRYRITKEEADLLINIREGKLRVTPA